MAVLTQKELDTLPRKGEVSIKKENLPDVKITHVNKKRKERVEIFEYHLLHPENGIDILENFQDTLIIDDKEYKRVCENGVVRSTEKELVDFLIDKGYVLMEKVKQK